MKLKENVDLIEGTMAHCYSVEYGGKIFLVDTGTRGAAKKIERFYDQNGKKPDFILITHYHMDHIGGLESLMQKYSCDVYVPEAEIGIMTHDAPMPEGTPAFLKLFTRVPRVTDKNRLKPAEKMEITGVKAVQTIGHTPGSTSYSFTELGILCVGDAVYNKNGNLQVNRMFSLDLQKAEESRKKIMSLAPVMVLPGHGDPIAIES